MKSKGLLKTIVVLIVLAAGGAYWYAKRLKTSATEYQTAAVMRGPIEQVVTATGQLTPLTNVQVGSQISGIIKEIYVDFNSPVKAGQIIAKIDSSFYEADLRSAEAELANAKAALELAQFNARRAEQLYKENLISQAEYENAIVQLHQAEAMVKIREAAVNRAKINLERCTIYSPVDGVVISRNVDVGQTVAASLSAPTLFVIANDLRYMQIDALVSEADIGNVRVGQPVRFTVDAYPTILFEGSVKQIRYGAITNQGVVSYDCIIGVTNSDFRLLPGMTANVQIITAKRDNALLIPNAALRFRPPEIQTNTFNLQARGIGITPQAMAQGMERGAPRQGRGPSFSQSRQKHGEHQDFEIRTVYILVTNAFNKVELQPVEVKLGISDGIYTEVIEGLSEGQHVVIGLLTPQNNNTLQAPNNPFGPPRMRR